MLEAPVRGYKCQHLNCFDLFAWIELQVTLTNNKWVCPICSERSHKIVRDEYFENCLKEAKVLGAHSLEFQRDGSYILCASKKAMVKKLDDSAKFPLVKMRKKKQIRYTKNDGSTIVID